MKKVKIFPLIVALLLGLVFGNIVPDFTSQTTSVTAAKNYTSPKHTKKNEKRVFINASMNADGTTSKMAKKLFGERSYTQIDLSEYNIPQLGQGEGDFPKIWEQLKDADVIVIGTPVYWSNMSGYLKTFVDHMQINNDLSGADLYMIVQGSDQDQSAAINSTYGTFDRIARRFKLNFVGIAQTDKQVTRLHNKMIGK